MDNPTDPTSQPIHEGYTHGDGLSNKNGLEFRIAPESKVEAFKHQFVDVNNLGDDRVFGELDKLGLPHDASDDQIQAALEARDAAAVALAEQAPEPVETSVEDLAKNAQDLASVAENTPESTE